MVQDTSPSPEMYLSSLLGNKCGGWGLAEDLASELSDEAVDYDKLKERSVLWGVSIPGETTWCSQELDAVDTGEHVHSRHWTSLM